MAKKASDGERKKAKWQGYVNFRPNESERAAIRERVFSSGRFSAWITELAADGYRVSHKWDAYRDAPVLEIYAQWDDMANAGRTLVVAHDDVLVAASALAFFMDEVAENGVWPSPERMSKPYDW